MNDVGKTKCGVFVGRLLLCIIATLALATVTHAAPPNVVLVMADDMGWGDVGFNGNQTIRTPHLDAMAANGLRFERFYAAAPVCSPTRGSCLTGRHPYRYGVFYANVGHLREPELTLAELLRERGYATGHFGKWHLGVFTTTEKDANRGGPGGKAHYAPPDAHGFDTYFSTESKVPTFDPMVRPRGVNRRTWWDPATDPADAVNYGTAFWVPGPAPGRTPQRATDNLLGDDSRVIMDRAIPFIRDAARAGKPFFAVVWFHTPHLPVVAGPEHTGPYAAHDDYARHYFGCITAMDEQVGRLRNELRELGVADNTMLWFCSDNGPEGNDAAPGSTGGLRGRKRSLFEGGVRVPGVLEWPARIERARSTSVPAVTSDYFPTIAEAVGAGPDEAVTPQDGVSLLPLIDGTMTERPEPIAFQSRDTLTLVDNRYKLVIQERGRGDPVKRDVMLFDLVKDRAETEDLSAAMPGLTTRMTEALTRWRDSCKRSLEGADY